MKLLLCTLCDDIFNIHRKVKSCSCGATGGKYLEDLYHAEYYGPATLIGFANPTFKRARRLPGTDFIAFTIAEDCPTFTRKI